MNIPAFPGMRWLFQNEHINPEGMTLRDYFAAKAMQAIWLKLDPDAVRDISTIQTVTDAYRLADAMLKARES